MVEPGWIDGDDFARGLVDDRNDLDNWKRDPADVLAEVREWCDAENKGKNPTERRIIDNCADDILAILDKHGDTRVNIDNTNSL